LQIGGLDYAVVVENTDTKILFFQLTHRSSIQSCIHGAGVLDDGVIYRQVRQRIILVWMQMITWSLNIMMMMMFIG
jgi:hypothetical protein